MINAPIINAGYGKGHSMYSRKLRGTVICAILLLATGAAAGMDQGDPARNLLTGSDGNSSPSLSETAVDQSPCAGCCDVVGCQSYCCPRWTASADFIVLDRIGGAHQTLVEAVPRAAAPNFGDVFTTPGAEILNSNDLRQGFSSGPRVGLIRHGDSGYDLELSYFQIDGWSSDTTVVPDPADWLVMRAPGHWLFTSDPAGWPGWIQTNQHPWQAMAWEYATELYSAEFNIRWNPSCRVTVLAGFRWVNLRDNLRGALSPPTMPEPPFWNGTTRNNLYGFQIGADGKIWERGRFSIEGLAKAGIFDNNAEATTEVSVIHKSVHSASASTNDAAFVGETGLQCKYRVAKSLVLKAGYEAIWLEGVALAPGQIQETYTTTRFIGSTVQALGVNCSSGVFCHGATAGLEYSF